MIQSMMRCFILVLIASAAMLGCGGSEDTSTGWPPGDGAGGAGGSGGSGFDAGGKDTGADHQSTLDSAGPESSPNPDANPSPDSNPPPGPDSSPTSCPSSQNGKYCGSDSVGGDPDTLYDCTNGVLTVVEHCDNGCVTEPQGTPDHCHHSQAGCSSAGSDALAWEASQLSCCAVDWENWCLKFVIDAYQNAGQDIPLISAGTAALALANVKDAGKLTADENPPCGAILFWSASSANGGDGHVVISNGDGTVSSSGWPGWTGSTNAQISWLDQMENASAAGWFLP